MIAQEQIIEKVEIGKYIFTLYKRVNPVRYIDHPYAVKFEKKTPKGRYSKTKTLENYVQKSIESAEQYITEKYRRIYLRMKQDKEEKLAKAKAQAELKASDHFELGDIIYSSWGYEQTNVNFYQVVKVTAKSIKVREIGQEMEKGSMYDHGMAHRTLAVKDAFLEKAEEFTLRVRPEGRLSSRRSEYFSKWDGSPKYVSSYY